MIRALLAAALCSVATPAFAQIANPDTASAAAAAEAARQAAQAQADLAAAMTTVAAAQQDAASARATANAAAATAAAACQPMAITPPTEVPGGTTGSGQNCRLVNAANNRISRTGLFTVGANGNIVCGGSTTCVWKDAAGNAAPLPAGAFSYPMFFTAVGTSSMPSIRCKVLTSTNTGFSAQCTQAAATVAILGAAVELLATSGTQVFALALPATQASQ